MRRHRCRARPEPQIVTAARRSAPPKGTVHKRPDSENPAGLQAIQERRNALHILRCALHKTWDAPMPVKRHAHRQYHMRRQHVTVLQPQRHHAFLGPLPRLQQIQGGLPRRSIALRWGLHARLRRQGRRGGRHRSSMRNRAYNTLSHDAQQIRVMANQLQVQVLLGGRIR